MAFLKSISDFLSIDDPPATCDLIFVLAGRPERKTFGWRLFKAGIAPRLILSVGRYEVRSTAQHPIAVPELLGLRDTTPPAQRHFWADFAGGTEENRSISVAAIKKPGTYRELFALAEYLGSSLPKRILIVSTSIHLRRVRQCCEKIAGFRTSTLFFVPVPEDESTFRRGAWWKHADQSAYLLSEYLKLAAYAVRY